MKKNQIIKFLIGSLIGMLIFSIGNGLLWYFIGYYYYKPGNEMVKFGREVSSILSLILGLVLGGIFGCLVGAVLNVSRPNLPVSFIIGFFVNGILPFLLLSFLLGGDPNMDSIDSKYMKYLFYGQFILGGILGISINLIFRSSLFNKLPELV